MINQPMPGLTPEAGDKRYLKTTGGTMSGDIAMGGKKVTGLGTPTADGDAANKQYVDDKAGDLSLRWTFLPYATTFLIALGGTKTVTAKVSGAITVGGLYSKSVGGFLLPIMIENSSYSDSYTLTLNRASERLIFAGPTGGVQVSNHVALPTNSRTVVMGVADSSRP